MPHIPGVTAQRSDSEPGLDSRGLDGATKKKKKRPPIPSLVVTEAYHLAQLERPRQYMAHRLRYAPRSSIALLGTGGKSVAFDLLASF